MFYDLFSAIVLYWISGTSVRTIVQGSWTRDIPQVLITAANQHNPLKLTGKLYFRSVFKVEKMFCHLTVINGLFKLMQFGICLTKAAFQSINEINLF